MKIRAFAERESDNWYIGEEPLETEGAKFSNNLNATASYKTYGSLRDKKKKKKTKPKTEP